MHPWESMIEKYWSVVAESIAWVPSEYYFTNKRYIQDLRARIFPNLSILITNSVSEVNLDQHHTPSYQIRECRLSISFAIDHGPKKRRLRPSSKLLQKTISRGFNKNFNITQVHDWEGVTASTHTDYSERSFFHETTIQTTHVWCFRPLEVVIHLVEEIGWEFSLLGPSCGYVMF